MGWKTVDVTPDMVGKRVAIFVGIEVKRPGEVPDKHQESFLENMRKRGCIAGYADTVEDAGRILGRP